jgi:hypothetical protein
MQNQKIAAGISRIINSDNTYSYNAIGPFGITPNGADSPTERPITHMRILDAFRFANWMANGQPKGIQDSTTTEDGAYTISELDKDKNIRNKINPNTGLPPIFYLPNHNELYKAAYYNPLLNNGSGGYYLFATQSNEEPSYIISKTNPNASNHYDITTGKLTVTENLPLDITQNFLTNIGIFLNSPSYYGTYDQCGNVYNLFETNKSITMNYALGGGWTSFPSQISKDFYTFSNSTQANLGFRLAGPILDVEKIVLNMLPVENIGNLPDPSTGYGSVSYPYKISQYMITIKQYTQFLNSIAKSDTNNLYIPAMKTNLYVSGIDRCGTSGNYKYSIITNNGNSENRPISYLNWVRCARFINWMSNGQPVGNSNSTTTENGSYDLTNYNGLSIIRNKINPNTGEKPLYFLPLIDELYKASFYSPLLNNNSGGYYLYGTQSNNIPSNIISETNPNAANFYNGYFYCMQQTNELNPWINQLTDVGCFKSSKSYYQLYDATGVLNKITENIEPSYFCCQSGGSYYSALQASRNDLFQIFTNDNDLQDVAGFYLVSL